MNTDNNILIYFALYNYKLNKILYTYKNKSDYELNSFTSLIKSEINEFVFNSNASDIELNELIKLSSSNEDITYFMFAEDNNYLNIFAASCEIKDYRITDFFTILKTNQKISKIDFLWDIILNSEGNDYKNNTKSLKIEMNDIFLKTLAYMNEKKVDIGALVWNMEKDIGDVGELVNKELSIIELVDEESFKEINKKADELNQYAEGALLISAGLNRNMKIWIAVLIFLVVLFVLSTLSPYISMISNFFSLFKGSDSTSSSGIENQVVGE